MPRPMAFRDITRDAEYGIRRRRAQRPVVGDCYRRAAAG